MVPVEISREKFDCDLIDDHIREEHSSILSRGNSEKFRLVPTRSGTDQLLITISKRPFKKKKTNEEISVYSTRS